MDNKTKYTDQMKGYLADYEETGDVSSLTKLYQMIKDGKVKLTAVDANTVGFKSYNIGDGKCSRCNTMCHKGKPVFFMNKIRWCESCATDEEKKNSFYRNYITKAAKAQQLEPPAEDENDCKI